SGCDEGNDNESRGEGLDLEHGPHENPFHQIKENQRYGRGIGCARDAIYRYEIRIGDHHEYGEKNEGNHVKPIVTRHYDHLAVRTASHIEQSCEPYDHHHTCPGPEHVALRHEGKDIVEVGPDTDE